MGLVSRIFNGKNVWSNKCLEQFRWTRNKHSDISWFMSFCLFQELRKFLLILHMFAINQNYLEKRKNILNDRAHFHLKSNFPPLNFLLLWLHFNLYWFCLFNEIFLSWQKRYLFRFPINRIVFQETYFVYYQIRNIY